jgi:hypothetical protein
VDQAAALGDLAAAVLVAVVLAAAGKILLKFNSPV